MLSVQDFKNSITVGQKLIMLVDDVNDGFYYGHTDSIKKVSYNLSVIKDFIKKDIFKDKLTKMKDVITIIFPFGRYIVILEVKKNKTEMSMMFLDFRHPYEIINEMFKGVVSENILLNLKRIKYEIEDNYNEKYDIVIIDNKLEPPDGQISL